jgi:hypothetical protein
MVQSVNSLTVPLVNPSASMLIMNESAHTLMVIALTHGDQQHDQIKQSQEYQCVEYFEKCETKKRESQKRHPSL